MSSRHLSRALVSCGIGLLKYDPRHEFVMSTGIFTIVFGGVLFICSGVEMTDRGTSPIVAGQILSTAMLNMAISVNPHRGEWQYKVLPHGKRKPIKLL